MSNRLRCQSHGRTTYFITDRCLQGRSLLRPSAKVNAITIGVLAQAVALFDIELYAHVFMSNHYHLLLSAPNAAELAAFMQYLKSNLARRLGAVHGWEGKFWAKRYSASPVLDDGAAIERMKYIFSNGVKENLVTHVRHFPGVHAHDDLVDGRTLRGVWVNHTESRRTGQTVVVRHTLRCAKLPSLAHLSDYEYRKVMDDLSREVHAQLDPNRKVLGQAKILGAHPHSRGKALKRRPRPLCHSTCPALKQAFRAAYKMFVAAYREAYAAFREGVLGTAFPPGSLPPVGWYGTRAAPT